MENTVRGEHVVLVGCAPTPLASYLKALGVARLISSAANHVSGEAADSHARCWWENECFHLRTTLSRDGLLHFFLDDYAPSPIIAPWNGRAGFLEGDAGRSSSRGGAVLMRAVENSSCARLKLMRRTVQSLRKNHQLRKYNELRARTKRLEQASGALAGQDKRLRNAEKRRAKKEVRAVKSVLLPSLRSETDPQHLRYIDACYVLSTDEAPAPLLGSGGNDGSRDFGVNFAEELQNLFEFGDGSPTARARPELESALFDAVHRTAKTGSMGQFSPGQSGPNATTGYEGNNPLNAWDVVLAMEGSLAFVGALTRRWGAAHGSHAAFPFTFELSGAGSGSLAPEDPNRPRGEVWTPVWSRPATFSEIEVVFGEGRLTLGERAAVTGLDAARSVAGLGVERGIGGFERYSLVQPDRKMPYQATPLGRFNTPARPRRDLVSDLEAGDWLNRARRLIGDRKRVPARARRALGRLEDAFFQMTAGRHGSEGTREALRALGSLVRWLASNPTARKDLSPPPLLSSGWVREADDGSAEYRVAVALAGVGLPSFLPSAEGLEPGARKTGPYGGHREGDGSLRAGETTVTHEAGQGQSSSAPPMAAHFAPLDELTFIKRGYLSTFRAWAGNDVGPTVVWGAGRLVPNLTAVTERRLVEASARGLADKALSAATTARLADVAEFLSTDFDDARCAALLAGLIWARPVTRQPPGAGASAGERLPFAYAAIKPVFTPNRDLVAVGGLASGGQVPIPPGLVARLRAGGNQVKSEATDTAVRLAMARMRASGLASPFEERRWIPGASRIRSGVPGDRLAAALLIPIGTRALGSLLKRAYPSNDTDTAT